MTNKLFKGIMPALITPVYEDNTVREDSARRLVEALLQSGVSGFYVCGATGEGPALSEGARMRMVEIVVEQVNRRAKVIDHVGAPDAQSAIRLAKHAQTIGCDAISSLPPTFFYNYGDDQIFEYYRALSENCSLPLLAYATGMFKQPDITPFIARLMMLPTMIGLKFTRNNYYEMRRVIELNDGDINVINGPDEMLICGLTMGADAGIGSTYNVMPGEYVNLYRLFTSSDFEGARRAQFKINRAVSVIIKHDVFASIKHILSVKGFDVGDTVFPGKRYTAEEKAALMRDLNDIHFFEAYT